MNGAVDREKLIKKTRFQKEMHTVLSERAMQLHIVKQLTIIYTVMDSEDCKPGRVLYTCNFSIWPSDT